MSQLQIASQLDWREPLWLLLALQPLLLWWLRRQWRRRHFSAYAEAALQPWAIPTQRQPPTRQARLRSIAYVLAWLLFALAAAGPRLPLETPNGAAQGAADIILAVDVSASTAATDTRPNRLRRAQIEIAEFLQHAPGNRIGIVLFAARAHVYVPLTSDYAALRFYLQTLDTLQLPTAGSRPGEALALAAKLLNSTSVSMENSPLPNGNSSALTETRHPAAIVLLSDGDWPQAVNWDNRSIPLYILGLGSEHGAAIPAANGEWLNDHGQPVVSRQNTAALTALAKQHAGRYAPVADDDSDWRQLYDHGIARYRSRQSADAQNTHWRELYAWPLLPGMLLLWLSLLPRRRPRHSPAVHTGVMIAPLLLGLLLFFPPLPATAASLEQQAWQHYQHGDYPAALRFYKQLPGAAGRLGEGASHYRLGDYPQAIAAFTQAVLQADDDTTRGRALFNLGNSYFQSGAYAKASIAFRDALLYRPQHEASQFNLQFNQALQQAVEQRVQQARVARRAGRGSQSARAGEDMLLGQNGSLSLGDAKTPADKPPSLPTLPNLSQAQLTALIEKGLAHIRLAGQTGTTADRRKAQQRQLALSEARLRMTALQDQQAPLWKRLFEMEEGFPAPLKTPREIPGVKPW